MILNQSMLQPGATIDLKGATVTVSWPLVAPKGVAAIANGTIRFAGNGGIVGSGGMCVIETNAHSGRLILQKLRFELPATCACIGMFGGGDVSFSQSSHNAGAVAMCQGGNSLTIDDVYPDSPADKYWFANFTNLLKQLRIHNRDPKRQIPQGLHEAAIRLMQVDDSIITGLNVKGSGYKQAVQDRPGGCGNPRAAYKQHLWIGCHISGGVDAGNFKDPTDKNFPFGTLALSRWQDGSIDALTPTTHGDKALSWDEMGIRRIELVNMTIGGKLTNQVITS